MSSEMPPRGAGAAGEPLRRVPLDMFKFATHDELYLSVMQVFGEANERLVTALTLDEVLGGLRQTGWYDPVTDEKLERALAQLSGPSLCSNTQMWGPSITPHYPPIVDGPPKLAGRSR
jgi:hypothetical protein